MTEPNIVRNMDIGTYRLNHPRSRLNKKELFENAPPPYMIIRPSLKGGLYISSGQISKLFVKLTYIHVQILTKPHE